MKVRHLTLRHQFVIACAVNAVRVIELQEIAPSPVPVLADDGVGALGRAPVAGPKLGAGIEIASEDRCVFLVKMPAEINHQPML